MSLEVYFNTFSFILHLFLLGDLTASYVNDGVFLPCGQLTTIIFQYFLLVRETEQPFLVRIARPEVWVSNPNL